MLYYEYISELTKEVGIMMHSYRTGYINDAIEAVGRLFILNAAYKYYNSTSRCVSNDLTKKEKEVFYALLDMQLEERENVK